MSRSTQLAPGGFNRVKSISLENVNVGTRGAVFGRETRNNKVDPNKDWRVRITLPPESRFAFRNSSKASGLMYALTAGTGQLDGVIFPYTPNITVTHNARYGEQSLTHSNYKSYFYEGSDVGAISIQGVFTCQNEEEALYIAGAIQFFRACTKMFFGKDDPKAGTPPTLVRLSGYGQHYLPNINCVITQFSHTMPEDVDYIRYPMAGTFGWMPVQSTMTVNLQPIVSRKRQSEAMLLDNFAQGSYLGDSKFGTSSDDADGGVF
jgi:hypothetical protein